MSNSNDNISLPIFEKTSESLLNTSSSSNTVIDVVNVDEPSEDVVPFPETTNPQVSCLGSTMPLDFGIFSGFNPSNIFNSISNDVPDSDLPDDNDVLPFSFIESHLGSNEQNLCLISFNAMLQARANRTLMNRNKQLQHQIKCQQNYIVAQENKLVELRESLVATPCGRPQKSITDALCKATKRHHLKKFYEINGITVREAFNILPNKLTPEEDYKIASALGMSQSKRRKLKQLLIKYGCDIFAANNAVEHILSSKRKKINEKETPQTNESPKTVLPCRFMNTNGIHFSDEDDMDDDEIEDGLDGNGRKVDKNSNSA